MFPSGKVKHCHVYGNNCLVVMHRKRKDMSSQWSILLGLPLVKIQTSFCLTLWGAILGNFRKIWDEEGPNEGWDVFN